MKINPWFFLAGVVTCSLALSTGARAAGKQKTFAVVPKSISISFYNDVERGCQEEGKKLGVNVIYTGPDTADAAKPSIPRATSTMRFDIATSANLSRLIFA